MPKSGGKQRRWAGAAVVRSSAACGDITSRWCSDRDRLYQAACARSWLSGNRCVEIAGANWWQGASVQLWDCHGGGNQYWWV